MTLATLAARILALRDPRNRLRCSLFAPQRALFDDSATQKAACCTRRAGKSHVAGSALVDAALVEPNTDSLYLGLTRRSSKSIMWPKFSEINQLLGKTLTLKESDLLITTANNSRIWVMGADMENLSDRLRGNKYKRVIIDEAQSFGPHLQYLIDDVIEPALLDLQGDLWLLGTPGPIPTGIFYDAMQSPASQFSKHQWSLLQNPHLPHAGVWLENLKRRKGWSDDNPTYRREYLGEWCLDPDCLVYRWSPKNKAQELPAGHTWHYVIGLDYGWHDATAFSVVAYADHCPNAYIIKSWGLSGLIPSRIAVILQELVARYDPEAIVCDTGGLGKSITEDFRQRYGLPVVPAEKTDKMAFIAAINGDFVDNRIFTLPGCEELEHQYQSLQYDDRRKEDPNMRNDLSDSALYVLRYARHYYATDREIRHDIGSPEWIAREERDMIRLIEEQTMKAQSTPDDELF